MTANEKTTGKLAQFVVETTYDKLPGEVIEQDSEASASDGRL